METQARQDKSAALTIARKMDFEIKRVSKYVTIKDIEDINNQVNEALLLLDSRS